MFAKLVFSGMPPNILASKCANGDSPEGGDCIKGYYPGDPE
jgi:hypothetical protein